ncbi:MAG: filamentous hemagglutinin N-terminal domain-containing protein, partial [Pseudomonadota bacterium]
MNKQRHRLVFNAARGGIVVVSEAARSGSKSSGMARGQGARRAAASHCAAGLLALSSMSAALVQAQIIADPSAPGSQRPTVLAAPNGVPLVNIQTPSAAGVSRNTYQQFDVGTPGAVLNNSRTNAPTQLGGWVQGNPWLAAGEARVILNEVNSHHPSHLNGFVEVAGRRAEVVIANPAGIQVNGAGFINASGVVLTTGTPVMNGGHLESFRVQQGSVRIHGAGLNTEHSDYSAILARAIEVNANVHAQRLHLVTGVNHVAAGSLHVQAQHAPAATGAAPRFALDVSELGGMYAGHIRLIGTEAGVGVRHHGTLAASVGDVHIDANGWLTSAGRIEAAQHLTVRAAHIDHQAPGVLRSQGVTALEASPHGDGSVTNRGLIDGADSRIHTHTLSNVGTGRLYGDRVAIAAHSVHNREESADGVTHAAAIAARERLDIGVQYLSNQADALLFSAGDLAIGGALDAQHRAITDASAQAQRLSNHGATIESLGDMALSAHALHNTNARFETELVVTDGPRALTLIQPAGSSVRIPVEWLRTFHFSRAWGYRFNTDPDPVAGVTPVLGQTPIPGVGEVHCTDPGNLDTCSRQPGADYPRTDPAWAFFGLAAPAPEPAAPGLPEPLAPPAPPADATAEALAVHAQAVQAYEAARQAHEAAWAQHRTEHAAWEAATEALYQTLDERISAYNQQFAGRDITHWTQYHVTQTVQQTQVTHSAPGQILAGGDMSLRGQELLNDKSRIVAGGRLQGDLHRLDNRAALGERVVSVSGTAQSSWTFTQRGGTFRTGTRRTYRAFSAPGPYQPPAEVSSLTLPVTQALAHTAPVGSGTSPSPRGLFRFVPDSHARYLIETDPRFANHRQWLSSDYLLQALAFDPTTTHKRLGDGFYEQRLIREQVAALTGRRFLADHRSDEAQYQALMTAAATFAHTHQLRPGIALSAAQVAQLTSDIVWLVTQTVQLPDGSSTTALVPRVYLAPRTGDLAADGTLFGGAQNGAHNTGSLIGARDIQLSLSGDLHNSGTIAGRRLVDLSAQNIAHSGLLQGDAVMLSARDDIRIQGGQVAAHSGLALHAGGNIGIESTTQSANTQAGANTFSRQGMDRIAGLYVSGPAGALLARAGGDIELIAAQLHNAGTGATQLQAAGDIRLGTARTEHSHALTWSAHNHHRQSRSQEVGSQVSGGGTVTLQAGHELHARAAQVNAQGALTVHAAGNLTLEAGHSSQSLNEAQQSTNRGFLSRATITTRSSSQSSTAQGSALTGQSVSVLGHNVLSIGTRFAAQGGELHIEGANQTLLYATQDSQRRETHTQTQRSTLGITTGQSETTHTTQSSTAVHTELLSDQAVRIGVGERTALVGARVQAPEIDFVR